MAASEPLSASPAATQSAEPQVAANGAKSNGAGESLLTVNNLVMHFPLTRGIIFQRKVGAVQAVDGISFNVKPGETLGLVGESGCGKSTTGRAILQLYKPTDGEVIFKGKDLTKLNGGDMRKMRRHLQMIFQDPYASLNPRMTVGNIVSEPMQIHNLVPKRERTQRVQELLETVGLNPYFANRYRMSSPAGSVSALESRGRWRRTPTSSSLTSLCPPSMSRFKPRSSISWRICKSDSG
jgi:ABC-type glutathione transport system ATPase component